jgi:hypothetical protein
VLTARDFSQVFDAYAQFEETLISARLDSVAQQGLSADGELHNCDLCKFGV